MAQHHLPSGLVRVATVILAATCASLTRAATFPRRHLVDTFRYAALTSAFPGPAIVCPNPASANGLVAFPPSELQNRYFLLRAGETRSEAAGRIETNPIATLGPSSYLTPTGLKQVEEAANKLAEAGLEGGTGCWVYYNKAAPSQQTAIVLQKVLDISTSNLVPDFAWLDPRGFGSLEGQPASRLDEIRRLDAEDDRYKPPPATDGTLSESLADIAVRVRNIISILETCYQGADVVLVSPSPDVISVLRAYAAGDDLRQHTRYSVGPGEFAILDLRQPLPGSTTTPSEVPQRDASAA